MRRLLAAFVVALLTLGLSLDAFAAESQASPVAPSPVGEWSWPLSPTPEVVEGFDPPATRFGPGHLGVDLLGWVGQPVTSVAAGTVSYAGQVAGTPVVVVVHGSERSTYQPVAPAVRRGDVVEAGELLGTLSNVNGHCLPLACLHLGRRAGDIYLDPLELLGGGRVRLLPRSGPVVVATPLPLLPAVAALPALEWSAMKLAPPVKAWGLG